MLFKKKKPQKTVLLFSIESGIVRAGIILQSPKHPPNLIFETHCTIAFQTDTSFPRLLVSLKEALVAVCEKIIHEGIVHIAHAKITERSFDEIWCTYGSPWYISETKKVSHTAEKDFIVTHDSINMLIKEHIEEILREYGGAGEGDTGIIIEQNVINIELNGYTAPNPFGKETREISMTLFVSIMSEAFKTLIEDVLSRHFSSDRILHHSMPLMLFSGIRDVLAADDNFLIIDVSTEVTDISTISKDIITGVISFPVGTGYFVRALSETHNLLPQEGEGLLRLENTRVMPESQKNAIESVISDWKVSFENSLSTLSRGIVPHSIFLLVDEKYQKLILEAISREQFAQNSRTLKPFTVTLLSGKLLSPFCLKSGGAVNGDPVLMLAAIYIDKIGAAI